MHLLHHLSRTIGIVGALVIARRDGTLDPTLLDDLLQRLPAVVVTGRAYVRTAETS